MKNSKQETYREKITVKHEFTSVEFQAAARKVQEIAQQTSAIKAKIDQLKADVKMLETTSSTLVCNISDGCEQVEVEALVRLDRKKGQKSYHIDGYGYAMDGRPVKVEPMTEADYQRLPGVSTDVGMAVEPTDPEERPQVEAADMSLFGR